MSNINLQILEKYVLNANKSLALESVTPFTEIYYYIELMTDLNKSENLQNLKKRVNDFYENRKFNLQRRNIIKTKYLLSLLAQNPSEKVKEELMKNLNDLFLHIKFNHLKPQKIEIKNNLISEENKGLKSKIENFQEMVLKREFYFDQFYKDRTVTNLNKIKADYFHKLDLSKIKLENKLVWQKLLNSQVDWFKCKEIVVYLKKLSKVNHNFLSNILNVVKKLDLQQLESLMEESFFFNNDNLFKFFFNVKFNMNQKNIKDEIENLKNILQFFVNKPVKYKQASALFRLKLLNLYYEENIIDEEEFVKYLKNPHLTTIYIWKSDYQVQVRNYINTNKCTDLNLIPKPPIDFLKKYLNEILTNSDGYKKYLNYFDEKILKNMYYSNKLMQGNNISNINSIFTDTELKNLNKKKMLSLEKNKSHFTQSENVELKIKLKNIKKLRIRVFEVNTENYLTQNPNGNYKDIKVESLIPYEEYSYTYTQSAMTIHNQKISFESITSKKRGVFIIDLIGEELNSKAIIFKGNLTLLYSNVTGRNCVLLDEKNNICKSKRTGLYIENKFFKSDDHGVVRIPYSVARTGKFEVIVVHDDFSCKSFLEIKDFRFKLESKIVYNSESFMPGLLTTLILQNLLDCNDRKSDLELLKNVEVLIVTTNLAGVEQKKVLKDLKLSNDRDLEIDFRVPAKMKSLNLVISGEVDINGKSEKISCIKNLNFGRRKMKQKLDMGLKRNNKKEYILELFGINGEPVCNEKMNVIFYTKNVPRYDFMSDLQGRVNLGKLEEVSSILITVKSHKFSFDINKTSTENYLYPGSMDIIENELVSFPIKSEDAKNVLLYKIENNFRTENLSSQVDTENNQLSVTISKIGTYYLHINERTIYLNVHKGSKKNLNGTNIINEDYILALDKDNNSEAVIAQVEEQGENYILTLRGNLQETRVHLLSSNYKTKIDNRMTTYGNQCKKYEKPTKTNKYFSEGKLSDELIYVYNRKNKNTYLGNTLDKPGLLIKRNKLKETVEEKELLDHGRDYLREEACHLKNNRKCYKRVIGGYNERCRRKINEEIILREFYDKPGKVFGNVNIDNGKVVIRKSDFEDQGFIYALVNTKQGNLFLEVGSEDREVKKIDLRLESSKKKGFVYRYDRSMDFLVKDSKCNIPHVDKQEYCFIEDVKGFYDAVMVLTNNSGEIGKWKFLANWNDLSAEEKLKKYDKFVSHEINLFLKLKDVEFFEGVVKPFILNKKEKTLVDCYLLENVEDLKNFACLSNIEQISPLECILLIDGLKTKYMELSKNLLEMLEMKSKLDHPSVEQTRRKFDSLISSQKKEDMKEPQMIQRTAMRNRMNRAPVRMSNMTNSSQRSNIIGQNYGNSRSINRNLQVERMVGNSMPLQNEMNYEEEECMELDDMDYSEQKNYIQPQVFTPLQGTVEYNEKKYYHHYNKSLSGLKKYWYDLACYLLKNGNNKNFFSENFIDVCDDPTEAISVLGFVDLEFNKVALESNLENNNLSITPKTNVLCLTKEIIQNKGEKGDFEIMIGQRFFDPNDKYKLNEAENIKYEKPVKEFIKGIIYESTIVVTNSTSTPLTVNIISEIPQGSIRFYSLDTMNVQRTVLDPLKSNSISYHFYFPESGSYTAFPASVVKDDQILGEAHIEEVIEVRDSRTIRDMDTISDILSTGDIGKILGFIQEKNILNPQLFNFNDINWLLKIKDFYFKLVPLLREKGVFNYTVWSYSIYHKDLETFKEFLNHNTIKSRFRNITYLSNSLVEIDNFEVREYYPLVNPRVHSLNKDNNILNKSFKGTYTKLLEYLFQKGKMTVDDKLILINYLILQDRMDESISLYSTIGEEDVKNTDCKIQYDYLSAYLDFINGYPNFTKAKKICEDYLSFPVLTWRNLFVEIANQLAEFEETDLIEDMLKKENDLKKNKDKAKTQASFNCELDKDNVKIVFENISLVVVKCYKIDLEVYFSMNSFNKSSIKDYTLVKPFNEQIVILLAHKDLSHFNYKIPENISKENLFIEISSLDEGLNKSQYLEYLPFSLNHHVNKEFGIIKLFNKDTKKPVPKIYMKCFAKYKNNTIKFYKDGYTDLRGSFDYVSLNKDNLDDISMFRILIVSKEFGCKIVETEPPVKIGRIEGEAKKIISKNWVGKQKTRGKQQMMQGKNNAYQQVYF